MSVGKYSPTVSYSYMLDQKWWEKNGGGYGNGKNPDSELDDEGYDSYGYSEKYGDGVDRAGYTEYQYLEGNYDPVYDEYTHDSYEYVSRTWSRTVCGIEHTSTYPQ